MIEEENEDEAVLPKTISKRPKQSLFMEELNYYGKGMAGHISFDDIYKEDPQRTHKQDKVLIGFLHSTVDLMNISSDPDLINELYNTQDKESRDFYLDFSKTIRIVVFGMTGAGKTVLATRIIYSTYKAGVNVACLTDVKNEMAIISQPLQREYTKFLPLEEIPTGLDICTIRPFFLQKDPTTEDISYEGKVSKLSIKNITEAAWIELMGLTLKEDRESPQNIFVRFLVEAIREGKISTKQDIFDFIESHTSTTISKKTKKDEIQIKDGDDSRVKDGDDSRVKDGDDSMVKFADQTGKIMLRNIIIAFKAGVITDNDDEVISPVDILKDNKIIIYNYRNYSNNATKYPFVSLTSNINEIWKAKKDKKYKGKVLIIIDEAHNFCNASPTKNSSSKSKIISLVKESRTESINMCFITQDPPSSSGSSDDFTIPYEVISNSRYIIVPPTISPKDFKKKLLEDIGMYKYNNKDQDQYFNSLIFKEAYKSKRNGRSPWFVVDKLLKRVHLVYIYVPGCAIPEEQ